MLVIKNENCGNSPKNRLIENLAVRLFENPLQISECSDTTEIQVAGFETPVRIDGFSFDRYLGSRPVKIEIHDAISHGKKGAIDCTA